MSVQATLSGEAVEPIQNNDEETETEDELQPEDLPDRVRNEVVFRGKDIRRLYSADCNECEWAHFTIILQPLNMTLEMREQRREDHYLDEEGNESETEYIEDTATAFYHVRPDEADSHLVCRQCARDVRRTGEEFNIHFPSGKTNTVMACGEYVDTHAVPPNRENAVDDWDVSTELIEARDTIIAEEGTEDTCMIDVTDWGDWFKDMVLNQEIRAAKDTVAMTHYDSMWITENDHDELQSLYEKMKARFSSSHSTALS